VLYCEACATEPGLGDRDSAEEWLHGYARLHADSYLAGVRMGAGSPSGCPACQCKPSESLLDGAVARRQKLIQFLRDSFTSDPAWNVIYPEGDDVPLVWRQEAAERSFPPRSPDDKHEA
jgi:hypothetical protein